jgi:hypothetical protein
MDYLGEIFQIVRLFVSVPRTAGWGMDGGEDGSYGDGGNYGVRARLALQQDFAQTPTMYRDARKAVIATPGSQLPGELQCPDAKETGPCFRPNFSGQNEFSHRKMNQSPDFAVLLRQTWKSASSGGGQCLRRPFRSWFAFPGIILSHTSTTRDHLQPVSVFQIMPTV